MSTVLEKLHARRAFFAKNYPEIKNISNVAGLLNTCPACGYPTLESRAYFEMCTICSWEDDAQDDKDADEVFGGPNSDYSLTEYRIKVLGRLDEIATQATHDNTYTQQFAMAIRAINMEINKGSDADLTLIKSSIEIVKTIADTFHPSFISRF